MAEPEMLTGNLSGEAFLRDFKAATEIAEVVPTFESWVLAGPARAGLVEQIRQNPVIAEEQLSVGGLTALLGSKEEQERMQGLIEEARRLDITRFLGYKATITAHDGSSPIIRYSVANPIATGMRYLRSSPQFKKTRTAKLTSLSPADKSFKVGEFRGLARPWRFTAFWEVYPFDKETGEPVVDVGIHGPKEAMPSPQYIEWWNANRA